MRKIEPNIPAELTPGIRLIIDRLGQPYTPAPLPDDILRGLTGTCFETCAVNTFRNMPKYTYVEGRCWSLTDKTWRLHAWLTDGVYAYDPTWGVQDNRTGNIKHYPAEYFGLPFDTHTVFKFMLETKRQGLLANMDLYPGPVNEALKLRELEMAK